MNRKLIEQMLDAMDKGYMRSGAHENYVAAITAAHAYLAQPEQSEPVNIEHVTDGRQCWCNPDVIEEDNGNVIVHNYSDNWQQYAKQGETAQQCIERHRAEQDALMTLYAQPKAPEPLTDEEITSIARQEADEMQHAFIFNKDGVWSIHTFARAVLEKARSKE